MLDLMNPIGGWHPDVPSIDDLSMYHAPAATQVADGTFGDVDNRGFFKEVSLQADLPFCGSNAGADLAEAVRIYERVCPKRAGVLPGDVCLLRRIREATPDLSRLYLSWHARNAMSPPTTHVVVGTYNRLIIDTLVRFGIPKESLWPYSADKKCTRPSILAERDAATNRFFAGLAVDVGVDRETGIMRALRTSPGVLFGGSFPSSILSYRDLQEETAPTLVWKEGEAVPVNHAMILAGASVRRQAYLVRNSWGKGFGFGGYMWLSREYVLSRLCSSFWMLVGDP